MNMESRTQLQFAADVIAFCSKEKSQEHAMYPNAKWKVIRFFHLVKLDDVDRRSTWDYKCIPRSKSVHSICFVSHIDVTLLNMRQLTCFCLECMDDNARFCENKFHVQPWMLHTLQPHNIS
jgi:hypothetical protein